MDVQKIIVWVIVGALAGTVIGRVAKGTKGGYGVWKNLGIGLVGALIGGFFFDLLNIDFLAGITISARDVVAALAGALVFLAIVAVVKKKSGTPAA